MNESSKDIHDRFLDLIIELLSKEGYTDILREPSSRGANADFSMMSPDRELIVGEFRLYRSSSVPLMSLTLAARKLASLRDVFKAKKALLITNAEMSKEYRSSIDFPDSALKLWGYTQLADCFRKHEDLNGKFLDILGEALPFSQKKPLPEEVNQQDPMSSPDIGKVFTISLRSRQEHGESSSGINVVRKNKIAQIETSHDLPPVN